MPLRAGRFTHSERVKKAAENNPAMRFGEKGDAVAIVQQALVDLGFPMPITTKGGRRLTDGIYGNETAKVVKQFQKLNKLDADGIVGRKTLARLDELIVAESALKEAELFAFGRRNFTLQTVKSQS
jgi:peptidoglycan hydrolase-like protein with peptidoglycan-binding domain